VANQMGLDNLTFDPPDLGVRGLLRLLHESGIAHDVSSQDSR
jgi:hypothetical protein